MSYTLDQIADLLHTAPEAVQTLIRAAVAPLRQSTYYHYVMRPRMAAALKSSERHDRVVLLFCSPDDALAFAQQLRSPELPTVRPIQATTALLHLLGDAQIARVIFWDAQPERLPPGLSRETLALLPGARVIERTDLMAQLAI